jgi:arabinogalactan oligomer/maltooligosaccharide transport system substrate-binding protein
VIRALALLALVACTTRNNDAVVLWHSYNGAEREALETSAARWNARHPERPIELVGVPHAAFADKLTSAIPNGNGPDLFIYAQDRIGGWVDAGIVEPLEFWLDDARVDRFSSQSIRAMDYKGSLWSLPMTVKSLALFYRTDLVPTPPRTTDDLLALSSAMKTRKQDGYAIAYANIDLYGHAPWLFGHGGQVMDDRGEIAIASPQSAQAMDFARKLVADKVAPARAEAPLVASLFNDGLAATAISGPWFITGIDSKVPWAVAELPIVSSTGKHAAPFLGAEGVLMSARAKDKDTAFAVMDHLTSDASALERATIARQVVPNPATYDDPAIAKDPVLAAFRAQLAHTAPMPMNPAMRMVWTPYKAALGEVVSGRAEAGAKLLAVEHEVQTYLDGMQRK